MKRGSLKNETPITNPDPFSIQFCSLFTGNDVHKECRHSSTKIGNVLHGCPLQEEENLPEEIGVCPLELWIIGWHGTAAIFRCGICGTIILPFFLKVFESVFLPL